MQAATSTGAATAGDSPTSFDAWLLRRRPRAPWRRFSAGHLVMVGAGLLGAALTLVALRSADHATSVAVASRDLLPGEAVSTDDLDFVEVDVGDDVLARLVRPGDESVLDNAVVSSRVAQGDVVARSVLAEEAAPEGRRAMSVPVDESRAVAGALEPGDRVDVVEVVDRESTYAVTDAEVLAVDRPDRTAIGGGIETFSVTIAVDDSEALEVARGIEDGTIVMIRATGAAPHEEARRDAP